MPREGERRRWPRSLADFIGYRSLVSGDIASARMEVQSEHIAANGRLYASVVVALAELCCAEGEAATLPEGASFETLEFKLNLVGTAREGGVRCEARLEHRSPTLQVWDAVVANEETGERLALFRCTQLLGGTGPQS